MRVRRLWSILTTHPKRSPALEPSSAWVTRCDAAGAQQTQSPRISLDGLRGRLLPVAAGARVLALRRGGSVRRALRASGAGRTPPRRTDESLTTSWRSGRAAHDAADAEPDDGVAALAVCDGAADWATVVREVVALSRKLCVRLDLSTAWPDHERDQLGRSACDATSKAEDLEQGEAGASRDLFVAAPMPQQLGGFALIVRFHRAMLPSLLPRGEAS